MYKLKRFETSKANFKVDSFGIFSGIKIEIPHYAEKVQTFGTRSKIQFLLDYHL